MTLVDNTLGAVTIHDIDGKEESLLEHTESTMGFDEKVDQVGTHEPLNLLLHVDAIGVGERRILHVVSPSHTY